MSWLRGPGISVKVAVGWLQADRGGHEISSINVADVDLIDADEWHSETTSYAFTEAGVRDWLFSEDGLDWLNEAVDRDRKNP